MYLYHDRIRKLREVDIVWDWRTLLLWLRNRGSPSQDLDIDIVESPSLWQVDMMWDWHALLSTDQALGRPLAIFKHNERGIPVSMAGRHYARLAHIALNGSGIGAAPCNMQYLSITSVESLSLWQVDTMWDWHALISRLRICGGPLQASDIVREECLFRQ